jgi:hypothetical protein
MNPNIYLLPLLLILQQERQEIFCFQDGGDENSYMFWIISYLKTGDFGCLAVYQQ